jgi:hypothetical protein
MGDWYRAMPTSIPGGLTNPQCPSRRQLLTDAQLFSSLDDPNDPHAGYIYAGGGLGKTSAPDAILIYESIENHHDGIHVLYVDGRVAWLDGKAARAEIARQRTR